MKIPNLVGSQTVLVAKGFIDLAILEMRDASVQESKPQSTLDGIGYDRREALVIPLASTMAKSPIRLPCCRPRETDHDRDS